MNQAPDNENIEKLYTSQNSILISNKSKKLVTKSQDWLTNSEVRSQKLDRGAVGWATYRTFFVIGIRATLQKHFAFKVGAARPNYFGKVIKYLVYS